MSDALLKTLQRLKLTGESDTRIFKSGSSETQYFKVLSPKLDDSKEC